MSQFIKKLVLVFATSLSITIASIGADLEIDFIFKKLAIDTKISIPAAKVFLLLKRISCIYQPVQFKKNQAKISNLLDFDSKVNAIKQY